MIDEKEDIIMLSKRMPLKRAKLVVKSAKLKSEIAYNEEIIRLLKC